MSKPATTHPLLHPRSASCPSATKTAKASRILKTCIGPTSRRPALSTLMLASTNTKRALSCQYVSHSHVCPHKNRQARVCPGQWYSVPQSGRRAQPHGQDSAMAVSGKYELSKRQTRHCSSTQQDNIHDAQRRLAQFYPVKRLPPLLQQVSGCRIQRSKQRERRRYLVYAF